jgi:hypothetical protein
VRSHASDAIGFPISRRAALHALDNGPSAEQQEQILMMDVVMLAVGLGLFAVTIAYAYACERL